VIKRIERKIQIVHLGLTTSGENRYAFNLLKEGEDSTQIWGETASPSYYPEMNLLRAAFQMAYDIGFADGNR